MMKLFKRRRRQAEFDALGRDRARDDILAAANLYLARSTVARTLRRAHIQDAVFLVRQHLLVSDSTLKAAGYRGVMVRPARRAEPWGGRSSYTPKKVRK